MAKQDAHVPGTVIGGVVASLLGRPRVTRDIDAMVLLDESEWEVFLAKGSTFGFIPRLSDPLPFAHRARVLLMRQAESILILRLAHIRSRKKRLLGRSGTM